MVYMKIFELDQQLKIYGSNSDTKSTKIFLEL